MQLHVEELSVLGNPRQRWWGIGQKSPLRLVSTGDRAISDDELALALAAGNEWAANLLWERFAHMVYGLMDRTLGSAGESEDLTQDVFLAVYSGIGNLREPSALRSFIYSVAVRKLRWHLRTRKLRRFFVLCDPGELPDLPGRPVDSEARTVLSRFYRLLDTLGADERTAFAMRQIEGMRLEDIAEATGVSLATVKRRVSRATERITSLAQSDPDLAPYLSPAGGTDET